MNKSILAKEIKLPKITIDDIKKLKDNKFVLICIFAVIFLIIICIIGTNLFNEQADAKLENKVALSRYETLKNAMPKKDMEAAIVKYKEEIAINKERVKTINSIEFDDVIKDFKENSPIKWNDNDATSSFGQTSRELSDYSKIIVSVKNFSASISKIKEFLEYVDNYEKIVRVDTITFSKNRVTGALEGKLVLSFYFEKFEEK